MKWNSAYEKVFSNDARLFPLLLGRKLVSEWNLISCNITLFFHMVLWLSTAHQESDEYLPILEWFMNLNVNLSSIQLIILLIYLSSRICVKKKYLDAASYLLLQRCSKYVWWIMNILHIELWRNWIRFIILWNWVHALESLSMACGGFGGDDVNFVYTFELGSKWENENVAYRIAAVGVDHWLSSCWLSDWQVSDFQEKISKLGIWKFRKFPCKH